MKTQEDSRNPKKEYVTEQQREAAKFLASIGGTQPDLAYIPRRRSEVSTDPENEE